MIVSKTAQNKILICLTHTEIIACFGNYENLFSMSSRVKALLNMLLRDIISEHKLFKKDEKISAKIKLSKGCGCEIALTPIASSSNDNISECAFEFKSIDDLTFAISELHKKGKSDYLKSHLYMTYQGYVLIISSENPKEKFFILNEFCPNISDKGEFIAHIKEYGKPLIINCAIEKFGKIFLK